MLDPETTLPTGRTAAAGFTGREPRSASTTPPEWTKSQSPACLCRLLELEYQTISKQASIPVQWIGPTSYYGSFFISSQWFLDSWLLQ